MFGLGWPELIIVMVILLLIFGGSRLTGVAKGLGESIRVFKEASSGEAVKDIDDEETLIDAAKKMGIKTEGKDATQILGEINEKLGEKEEA